MDEAIPFMADLAILATPVGSVLQLLDKIPQSADLILDVGSTKVDICRKAEERKLPFLGGHPLTGSERSGPDAASARLFAGEPFFLCPISSTPPDAVSKLSPVLQAIGARPIVMSADEHDSLVAQISHLPQILSTLLADQTQLHKSLAGPGWRSVTRLAASPFHIWRDILQTSGYLPEELRSFISRLHIVLDALEAGNIQELEGFFERANSAVSGGTHE
jgi:prephenate dehydrogenase